MNRIKAQTGTSVIIPSDSTNSDVIRIEGDPKGVKAAKQQLLEIASKMVRNHLVLRCSVLKDCKHANFLREIIFVDACSDCLAV